MNKKMLKNLMAKQLAMKNILLNGMNHGLDMRNDEKFEENY